MLAAFLKLIHGCAPGFRSRGQPISAARADGNGADRMALVEDGQQLIEVRGHDGVQPSSVLLQRMAARTGPAVPRRTRSRASACSLRRKNGSKSADPPAQVRRSQPSAHRPLRGPGCAPSRSPCRARRAPVRAGRPPASHWPAAASPQPSPQLSQGSPAMHWAPASGGSALAVSRSAFTP
jgi:hypothetical protein